MPLKGQICFARFSPAEKPRAKLQFIPYPKGIGVSLEKLMNWKIPLSDINFGKEEEDAVLRVIRSKWLSMGEETQAFEREFAEYIGVKHAIAVANGTAALHLAMLSLEIGAGDAVIQPAVNFVASANMTVAIGALPLFADICSIEEPVISPESVRDLIEIRLKHRDCRLKALIVMHYGGYNCRMNEIKAICDEYKLALIEDACHGVGGSYENIRFGTWGDAGCFSFFSNKNLVTGEGGMITTDRDDLADKLRLLRSHGMTSLTWDRHKGHAATYNVAAHGYNYRMDEIRSAIGREQLKKLDYHNQQRRELTAFYWDKLKPLENQGWKIPFHQICETQKQMIPACHLFVVPPLGGAAVPQNQMIPACHLLPVVAPDADTRWRCADALKSAGIQTSLHYPFILDFSVFSKCEKYTALDKAEAFCKRVITLPLYPTMEKEDIRFISEHFV